MTRIWWVALAIAGCSTGPALQQTAQQVAAPNCPAAPAVETCNNLDDDCDGIVDEDVTGCASEAVFSCAPGQLDMLDWMTLDPDLRGSVALRSATHPLYTVMEGDRFWWLKTDQGDTWDLVRFDDKFLYFASTELGFHSPWACKPAVKLHQWRAAPRCVTPGVNDDLTNPSSQFTLQSSGEVQVTSGLMPTEFAVQVLPDPVDWGPAFGTLPTVVLGYHWDGNLEQYFLTQRYGLMRWRLSRDGTTLAETTFGTEDTQATVPAPIYACNRIATYERASGGVGGVASTGVSSSPSIDSVGRFVAFASSADNLVAGDSNGVDDVFVYDGNQNTTVRASVASDGTQADGSSGAPAMAGNGRYVAFESDATNLVAGDTNVATDVFVFDRKTGQTTRVSIGVGGVEGNGPSYGASISADGCRIAFASKATNLVAGDTNDGPGSFGTDVFVRDRCTGETRRASVTSTGAQASLPAWEPSISPDGRFVAYSTGAAMVPDDTNGIQDIYVYDWFWNVTLDRASIASDGTQTDGQSNAPRISRDGRYVAFMSVAGNLVPGDTNGTFDVFVRDRWTQTLTAVTSTGGMYPALSDDGRFVAYLGFAPSWSSWLYDTWTNEVVPARAPDGSIVGNAAPAGVAVAARNRNVAGLALADRIVLAFVTDATTLFAGDNAAWDVVTRTIHAP